jgi:hypothetical protein
MHDDTRDWLTGLREFAAAHRATRTQPPLQPDERTHAATAAERMIIGADLATRLPEIDRLLDARRAWIRSTGRTDADPEPALVATTSAAGMAALAEWLDAANPWTTVLTPRLAVVSELEYRLWCIRHPDDDSSLHVNLWSWVKTSVPRQRWPEFARHPLRPDEVYWLHRTGIRGCGASDGRQASLWKFTGQHAAILEARVAESRV